MGYLTKYGTIWGQIPNTAGNVYWVSAGDTTTIEGRTVGASDDNDGLSPERPLRRATRGVDLATGAGDVVVLLPGVHTVTASIAVDTANVTIMGLPGGRGNNMYNRATLLCSAVDQTMNVTVANIEIAYITFVATTSQASAQIDFSAAADRLYVHDCSFDFTPATAATTILGIDALGAASYVFVDDCRFITDGAFGAGIDMTATLNSAVRECWFYHTTGTLAACITTGAATAQLLVTDCKFWPTGTAIITGCVVGTGATIARGVLLTRCICGDLVTSSQLATGFDATECELAENYVSGIGATDGGVLITAIA